MITPGIALKRVNAALGAHAAQTAGHFIEARVAAFEANPRLLDAISVGLSKQTPERMRATIQRLTAGELPMRIFGGEVVAINLRAALIYAQRRCEAS